MNLVTNEEVKILIEDWFGKNPFILYAYEGEGVWIVCVVQRGVLYFMRYFRLGESWAFSEDKSYELKTYLDIGAGPRETI